MTGFWWDEAACKGAPEDVVAGFQRGRGASARADEVRAVCGPCPVRDECLADAMHHEGTLLAAARWGIRGGLTPHERARLAGAGPRGVL